MVKKSIPMIVAEKIKESNFKLDPNGFFIINTNNDMINVEYYKNIVKEDKIVSGKLLMVFQGIKAQDLSYCIAKYVKDLRSEHYIYLGRELILAEQSIENKTNYEQS